MEDDHQSFPAALQDAALLRYEHTGVRSLDQGRIDYRLTISPQRAVYHVHLVITPIRYTDASHQRGPPRELIRELVEATTSAITLGARACHLRITTEWPAPLRPRYNSTVTRAIGLPRSGLDAHLTRFLTSLDRELPPLEKTSTYVLIAPTTLAAYEIHPGSVPNVSRQRARSPSRST